MFTPQKMGWPGWSPVSAERREKGKILVTAEARSEAVSPVKGLIERSVTTTTSTSTLEDNGEPDIWRRFRDAGTLDENMIEKKDRAVLMTHLSSLESELYDYQYNMGLLLMERKEWNLKTEKLKAAVQDAEEDRRRDLASHLRALSEAEKREENLKKALAIEKQCVSDLEKALKSMRAESAELKVSAEGKLTQARDMAAGTEEKSLLAESKLCAADALQAEVRRQQGVVERKLQEVEAREDTLRRERLSFKTECETHEVELNRQRKSLLDWEKKLQEGQERLLDGQKLLNQREEYVNQRDESLKKVEMDLQDIKKQLDKERISLWQSETDLSARLSSLTVREESAIKKEAAIDEKEQELLLLQEKVAIREHLLEQREHHLKWLEESLAKERERIDTLERAVKLKEDALPEQQKGLIELQRVVDQQKLELEAMKADCKMSLAELEGQQDVFAQEKEEFEQKLIVFKERENECRVRGDKLTKKEQLLEKKAEKQKEKEKELEAKMKTLKDKERALKVEEKQLEIEKKSQDEERVNGKLLLQEIQDLRSSIELKQQQLIQEEEKLQVTEQEREDLLKMQRCLKEEIDDCRACAKAIALEAEELKREKERFEKEWDILDEKRDEVKGELKRADEEARRVSKWLRDEEARLKEEKRVLREQIEKESEGLRAEKEEFTHTVEGERAEWFASVEKERENLAKGLEVKRREMENNIEKHIAEAEKQRKEKEIRMKKEIEQEKEIIEALKDVAEKKMEAVQQEKAKLEKERQEVAQLREEAAREWSGIKKDIDELQMQREKLKEQREALIKERDNAIQEADKLRKLKAEHKVEDHTLQLPPWNEVAIKIPKVSPSKQDVTGGQGISIPSTLFTPERPVSIMPGRLSWLQKCVSGLFLSPEGQLEPFISKEAARGGVEESAVPRKMPLFDAKNVQGLDVDLSEDQEQSTNILKSCRGSFTEDNDYPKQEGHRWKGKGYQRTRSIHAVVEDAKALLQPRCANEWNVMKGNREDELLEIGEVNAASSADAQGIDSILSRQGRKRQYDAVDIVTDADVDDNDEGGSKSTMIGGKRKQHQRNFEDSNLGKQSSAIKRYNFRRSTITKVGAPKPSDHVQAPDVSKGESLHDKIPMADTDAHVTNEDVVEDRLEIVLQEHVEVVGIQGNVVSAESGDISEGRGDDIDSVKGQQGYETIETAAAVESDREEAEAVEDGAEEECIEPLAEVNVQVVELDQEDGEYEMNRDVDQDEDEGDDEVDDDKRTSKQMWWDYLIT